MTLDRHTDIRQLAAGVPNAYIFAETREEREKIAVELRTVAEATRNSVMWASADPVKYSQLASRLNLGPGKWPAFAIEDLDNGVEFAFPSRGSFDSLNRKGVHRFVDDVLSGKVGPIAKTGQILPDHQSSVVSVEAEDYNKTISGDEKDVIMLYYSPTCSHCRKMAPSYETFAIQVQPVAHTITVARIDAKANEVWPSVSTYPTVRLFRHGEADPILYSGNRTAEDLVSFVKENGSQDTIAALRDVLGHTGSGSLHDEL